MPRCNFHTAKQSIWNLVGHLELLPSTDSGFCQPNTAEKLLFICLFQIFHPPLFAKERFHQKSPPINSNITDLHKKPLKFHTGGDLVLSGIIPQNSLSWIDGDHAGNERVRSKMHSTPEQSGFDIQQHHPSSRCCLLTLHDVQETGDDPQALKTDIEYQSNDL